MDSTERRTYYCNYCGHILDKEDDIVRFYRHSIYHLDCYVNSINANSDYENFPCPKCHTTGKFWDRGTKDWIVCKSCRGKGFQEMKLDTEDDDD